MSVVNIIRFECNKCHVIVEKTGQQTGANHNLPNGWEKACDDKGDMFHLCGYCTHGPESYPNLILIFRTCEGFDSRQSTL